MDLEKIKQKRQEFIIKSVKSGDFDLCNISNFFEIKPILIKNDLKEIYGEGNYKALLEIKNNNSNWLNKMLQARDIKIALLKEKGYSDNKILEEIGMWHFPVYTHSIDSLLPNFADIKIETPLLKNIIQLSKEFKQSQSLSIKFELLLEIEKIIPNFSDCIYSIQKGVSKTELQKKYNLTTAQLHWLSKFSNILGLESTPEQQLLNYTEIKNSLNEIISQYSVPLLSKYTGLSINALQSFRNNTIKNTIRTPHQIKVKDRREKVWELYTQYGMTNGRTEQEIANELGISRATVVSDIKQYKLEHPNEIDETQLYRQRHIGITKYTIRAEKKEKVVEFYKALSQRFPDMPLQEKLKFIDEHFNVSSQISIVYLKEEGLIAPHLNSYISDELLNTIQNEAQIGLQHKGQFGYGSTQFILQNYGYSSTNRSAEKSNTRNRVLQHQRNTMALIRNNPEALSVLQERGNIRDVLELVQNDNSPIGRNHLEQAIDLDDALEQNIS